MINKNSVNDIITVLEGLGYQVGVCIEGSSSYIVENSKFLPDGRQKDNIWEIWAYIPDPNFKGLEEDDLCNKRVLTLLSSTGINTPIEMRSIDIE
jgi:hypothetical protein